MKGLLINTRLTVLLHFHVFDFFFRALVALATLSEQRYENSLLQMPRLRSFVQKG